MPDEPTKRLRLATIRAPSPRSARGLEARTLHREAVVRIALDPGADLPGAIAGTDRAGREVLPGGFPGLHAPARNARGRSRAHRARDDRHRAGGHADRHGHVLGL